MAAKSKKRKQRRTTISAVDQVKRLLERGNYKQALKEARAEYRQNPIGELRCFLEHAYLGRAQELIRRGQRDDARRIVGELQELGVTELAVQTALPDVLISVGLSHQLLNGQAGVSDEERNRLTVKAADLAVIHPEVSPQGMPDVQSGARAVRDALTALERGDDAAAMACLKDLPRQSPFADWKLFARGLAAFYRQDPAEMLANWKRLDASRPAAKIAAPLRVMAGDSDVRQDALARAKLQKLEKLVTEDAVLNQLSRLRSAVTNHDWKEAIKLVRQARGGLIKLDANLVHRTVWWLTGVFVSDGMVNEVERLARAVDGVPLDPRWNRARALAIDVSEFREEEVASFWRRYLEDLDQVVAFTPRERDIARGLVWLRVASAYADEANDFRLEGEEYAIELQDAEEEALEAFERSLSFLPSYVPAYEQLAEFQNECGRDEEAARTFRRLLERVPDNVDVLVKVASHHIEDDEPLVALEYARRARTHKPLDTKLRELERACRIGAVRHLGCDGKFDEARQHLAVVDRLSPDRKDDFDLLARKAILETKAGCAETVQGFVRRAENTLEEMTAFWLAMAVQAFRFGLPKEEIWLYQKRWQDALKRRCRSQTAGLMCKLLTAHLLAKQAYAHSDEYVAILLNYVRRCSRVKWQAEDLFYVCQFLQQLEEKDLLEKYVKQGTRKCPQAAAFHAMAGILELEKGPFACNRRLAAESLRTAVRLHEESPNPRDQQVMEQVRKALLILEQFDAAVYDDYYDEDDDFVEDDEFLGPPPDIDPGGIPPDGFLETVRRICGRLGIDPQDLLDQIGAGSLIDPGPDKKRGGKS